MFIDRYSLILFDKLNSLKGQIQIMSTEISKKQRIYEWFSGILFGIIAIYLLINFLPLPHGIKLGLDPSWEYAISYTSWEKLTYGKDIIFTYGPLGYLIHGAVINDNFWSITLFRCFIHLVFFSIAIREIIKLFKKREWVILLIFSLGILAFYFLPKSTIATSTDYAILFIFLLILPYEKLLRKKYQVILYSMLLGGIAGFSLMTKFSLGIATLGAGILYFGGNIIGNFKDRKNLINNIYKLSIFSITTFWSATIFLDGLSKDHASIIEYLKNSWAISSGYSSAMSIVGPRFPLIYALLEIILFFIVLIQIAKNKPNSIGYNLSLAFVTWITFKHGFIRDELNHTIVFIKFIPLLVYLGLKNEFDLGKKTFWVKILKYFILLVLINVFILFETNFFPYNTEYVKSLSNFPTNLSYIFNLNQYQKDILESNQKTLSQMKLPTEVLNSLKNKKVDIIPWEISLIPANNLNWQPRPIFQSYSAYTSSLDKINSESLLKNRPDNIFYNFSAIDGRHPFFDEPETFVNVFCNYQNSSLFPDFLKTQTLENIILLEQRKSNICSQEKPVNNFSLSWNQDHSLLTNDQELIRAKIQIKYSFFGKIYKTLFRSPPVMIKINYADGQTNSYRIIPENANNGVIISHLPTNDQEALRLFQGELPLPVKSFSFSNRNFLLYKSQINVELVSSNLSNLN